MKYVVPKMEILELKVADVIRTSDGTSGLGGGTDVFGPNGTGDKDIDGGDDGWN